MTLDVKVALTLIALSLGWIALRVLLTPAPPPCPPRPAGRVRACCEVYDVELDEPDWRAWEAEVSR